MNTDNPPPAPRRTNRPVSRTRPTSRMSRRNSVATSSGCRRDISSTRTPSRRWTTCAAPPPASATIHGALARVAPKAMGCRPVADGVAGYIIGRNGAPGLRFSTVEESNRVRSLFKPIPSRSGWMSRAASASAETRGLVGVGDRRLSGRHDSGNDRAWFDSQPHSRTCTPCMGNT